MSQRLAYAGFIAAYGIVALILVFGKAESRPRDAMVPVAALNAQPSESMGESNVSRRAR